ncbi:hypothetical protein O181_105748 [Austropuccinia psidii MF-1]|uniref:Uncharacterized protein n=1 Tax=Austropuccinia psidii MF-1 TaxID=1389203 RepID=A0A9Q3JMN1_9BASI|nr:hypothetical protein [Austropuccinia psidii MF-1]
MENDFGSAISNSERDKPLNWFLKQKDRLSSLHPDISESMLNMKILRKCGGELKHSIKCRCVDPCSTEEYINVMEDIITRTRIGSTSHLANSFIKKTKINEVQVLEDVQCAEEKDESDQYSAVSEDTPAEYYSIENITAFFAVNEAHIHLRQYSEDFYNLINIQDAGMCKAKPARGKGYTSGASCITLVLMNDFESKVNLDTGEFRTFIGKDYLQIILPEWKSHLLPIEGVQFSSASNNTYHLGILDTNLVFAHPAGSIIMKTGIELMDNCTSQHIILGNDYLDIYGADINNYEHRYFPIGENKRQNFAFSDMTKQISIVSSNKDTHKDKFVNNQLIEAKASPSLSPKARHDMLMCFTKIKMHLPQIMNH